MSRLLPFAALLLAAPLAAQQAGRTPTPAAIAAIRQQDLQRDLYTLAGDAMRGREAGTLDELRASTWLADRLRQIGLAPRGDDGSFFQWWNMRRTRVSPAGTSVRIGGDEYELWRQVIPLTSSSAHVSTPTVFVPDLRDTTPDLAGRVAVAVLAAPPPAAVRTTTNTYRYNYARAAIAQASRALIRRGADAILLIGDAVSDSEFSDVAVVQARGAYDVVGGVPRFTRNADPARRRSSGGAPPSPPVFLLRRSALERLRAGSQPTDLRIEHEDFDSPSVNVVGAVRGTDPELRDEYVVFSSHQDHDGLRFSVDGDSIWNGADDNASTSVALLAIARAWVRHPGRRSALFVFHGAEERGLLGSRYFVAHPVVPLQAIVAVLNGDMIGRNDPDTAMLLGSQPPHRNSAALVQMALDANRVTSRFVIDSSWDRPTHPEGWYFRSDHVPYAERGVPSLFFTTGLHPDYHTPRDEPQRIDYAKLTRMTRWMFTTGWIAANADHRPATDSGFVLR
jgi:hypothetical protein